MKKKELNEKRVRSELNKVLKGCHITLYEFIDSPWHIEMLIDNLELSYEAEEIERGLIYLQAFVRVKGHKVIFAEREHFINNCNYHHQNKWLRRDGIKQNIFNAITDLEEKANTVIKIYASNK